MLIGFRFTKNKRKREITVEKLFGGLINPEGTEKLFPSMSLAAAEDRCIDVAIAEGRKGEVERRFYSGRGKSEIWVR